MKFFIFLSLLSGVFGSTGTFTTLSLNVAGLIEFISSAVTPRSESHKELSVLLNEFDIVNVQEDFNYHKELYDSGNTHEFRTSTSGPMGWGSGLNTLSRFPIEVPRRQSWGACQVSDCLTPKGFDFLEVVLPDNVLIHVYNLHAQAEDSSKAKKARLENFKQLAKYIEDHSSDHAVLIYGDFNSKYNTDPEALAELLELGFKDVWVETIRSQVDLSFPVPEEGELECDIDDKTILNYTTPDCEDIDKIMFRSNGFVTLTPVEYKVLVQELRTPENENLSDHPGIFTFWRYETHPEFKMTNEIGGHIGGRPFSDITALTSSENIVSGDIVSVELFFQRYFVGIKTTYTDNSIISHGIFKGKRRSITLFDGEHISEAEICSFGRNKRTTRVHFVSLTSNTGRTSSSGNRRGSCETISLDDRMLIGFQGRKGKVIDRLGLITKELT